MSENKTGKYLKYAIGEIVLVVIGILIALQINNWNEQRKDRIEENVVLTDLITNLESNISFLESWQEEYSIRINSGKIVLNVLQNEMTLHDSLNFHFHKAMRGFGGMNKISKVSYDILKNEGFSIIKNKIVLNEIMYLFEVNYADLINIDNQLEGNDNYHVQVYDNYFLNKGGSSQEVQDPTGLINDVRILAILTRLYQNRIWISDKIDHCLSETKRVLEILDENIQN